MTGNTVVPTITAPTKQVYQPTNQAQGYTYAPKQFSATPSSGPVSVGGPQGSPYGPTLMQAPVQGYKATRTGDYAYRPQAQAPEAYSYKSQYTPGPTTESTKWARPVYTVPFGMGRLFPGLQAPSYDDNGNMITAMEANAQ